MRHTEETKRKMSVAKIGNRYRYGKLHSGETKEKIRLANMSNKYRLGKLHSEDTKKKLSIGLERWWQQPQNKEKMRRAFCQKTGVKNSFYGKHHSIESRHRMSIAKKGIQTKSMLGKKHSEETKKRVGDANRGAKSALWRGGISFEPYGAEFNNKLKKQIRQRDNFTCQECEYTEEQLGHTLGCHHVDYNKRNNDSTNLISLCKSCHSQTNFRRSDWENYFVQKVGGR